MHPRPNLLVRLALSLMLTLGLLCPAPTVAMAESLEAATVVDTLAVSEEQGLRVDADATSQDADATSQDAAATEGSATDTDETDACEADLGEVAAPDSSGSDTDPTDEPQVEEDSGGEQTADPEKPAETTSEEEANPETPTSSAHDDGSDTAVISTEPETAPAVEPEEEAAALTVQAVPEDAVQTTPSEDANKTPAKETAVLTGRIHVQKLGWRDATVRGKGIRLGTTGKSLRVEAYSLKLTGASSVKLSYKAYVQGQGWQDWRNSGKNAGTTGKSLRLEALRIRLTGKNAGRWTVQYRTHVQGIGWTAWTADGEACGTTGYDKRMEAVDVRVVPVGTALPVGGTMSYEDAGFTLQAHVQSAGWQKARTAWRTTAGKKDSGKRIEALRITRPAVDVSGDMQVRAYSQGTGWQGWRGSGKTAGTVGKGKRVEAVKIRLTGELSYMYDVWYRVYVQGAGWLAWAKNGKATGSTGLALRLESVAVALVPKGAKKPSGNSVSVNLLKAASVSYSCAAANKNWMGPRSNGATLGSSKGASWRYLKGTLESQLASSLSYSVYGAKGGWSSEAADGKATKAGSDIHAVRISLTGKAASVYRLWYRAYVKGVGWTGWAEGGEAAGSQGLRKPLVALQLRVLSVAQGMPAGNENPALITASDAYYAAQSLSQANATQHRIVDAARKTPWAGSGLCAAWVENVYANAGLGRYWGNACDLYDLYCTSSDFSQLKVGMIVSVSTHSRTYMGGIYGHVGIYIGDGKIMDNVTASVRTISLKDWCEFYGTTVRPMWGWLGKAKVA